MSQKRKENVSSLEISILDREFSWKSPCLNLKVENDIQVDWIQKNRNTWIAILQEQLKNSFPIQIKVEILAPNERKIIPYTNIDKWKFLQEKHPHLSFLQERLGLELE